MPMQNIVQNFHVLICCFWPSRNASGQANVIHHKNFRRGLVYPDRYRDARKIFRAHFIYPFIISPPLGCKNWPVI